MRKALAVVLAGMMAGGCAYESQYAPPPDGRARAVWQNDNVAVHLGAQPVTQQCLDILRQWSADKRLRLAAGYVPQDRPPAGQELHGDPAVFVGFWVPVYYGPPILLPPAPHLTPIPPHVAVGGGFGSLGGGGSSGDLGKALAVLAVIALIVLPIVDVAVASATPENDKSSDAIDQVNVFNDYARVGNTPCSLWGPQ